MVCVNGRLLKVKMEGLVFFVSTFTSPSFWKRGGIWLPKFHYNLNDFQVFFESVC